MKQGLRSLIVFALIVSIGTGSVFFLLPKKTEAGTSDCLAGILAGKLKGKGEVLKTKLASIGMTVPTNSKAANAKIDANSKIASDTLGNTQGFTVQRCIVEPLVTVMVRSLLNTFTAQTISWINGGFKGSPLYVTNPQGFLTDIADQSLGQFIGGLGDIGQILCSPFDLQLRFSLNLQFGTGGGYYQEIGCRLTDIQQNLQKTFTGGSFGANGWDNWIQLTAQPQNNPYGAFIKASESLSSTIGNRQETNLRQLDWGNGFLSSTECTAYSPTANASGGHDCVKSEVNTPGSVIEGQLTKTLGVEVERVGLAKDIDAILGALVNQLINQVMGGVGGLLGASKRPSAGSGNYPAYTGGYPSANGTYPSYAQSPVERARNSTPASILAANEAAQGLPDGLFVETSAAEKLGPTATDADGNPTGPSPMAFCAAFKKNIYSASKARDEDPLTNDTPVVVKIDAVGKTGNALAAIPNTATQKAGTPPQWNLADYNRVATFCQSVNITAPIRDAARNFNERTKGEDTPNDETSSEPTPQTNREITLASWALDQSDVYQSGDFGGPDYAVSGYGWSDTRGNSNEDWWSASASQSEEFSSIKIRSYSGWGGHIGEVVLANLPTAKVGASVKPSDFEEQFVIFRYDPYHSGRNKNFNASMYSGNADDFQITWVSPVEANAILINSRGVSRGEPLIIGGIKAYRPAALTASGTNTGSPQVLAISFIPAEQEARPNADNHYNLSFRDFLSTFSMTANQSQSELKARIKFSGKKADGSSQTLQFSSVFAPDSLKINNTPIDVEQNSVTFNNNFSLTQGQTVDYRIMARITENPVFNMAETYLSYKIFMEFFKVVDSKEQVLATQSTTFKIQ